MYLARELQPDDTLAADFDVSSSIHAGHCRFFCRALTASGVDPRGPIEDAGLGNVDLDGAYEMLDVRQFLAFLEACARAVPDPYLGLQAGMEARFEDMQVLGLLARSLPRAGDIHGMVERFARLWPGASDSRLLDIKDRKVARLRLPTAMRGNPLWSDYFAARSVRWARMLLGEVDPVEVFLTRSMPQDTERYRELFRCPVHFSAAHDEVHFAGALANRRMPFADATVVDVLVPHLELLLKQRAPRHSELPERIKLIVAEELASGTLNLPHVASLLQRTERTLRRQLAALGTSYQQLVEEVRRERALSLLRNGHASAEVARLLGFSEPSVFYRAFKRWTGQTVGEYRRDNGNNAEIEAEQQDA